jgi:hypothetical protein
MNERETATALQPHGCDFRKNLPPWPSPQPFLLDVLRSHSTS